MSKTEQGVEIINEELQEVLEASPKDRLARSARLLGMYLALYKHRFGELTAEEYRELNSHVAVQDALGRAIYTAGMRELIDMLALVAHHEDPPQENPQWVN